MLFWNKKSLVTLRMAPFRVPVILAAHAACGGVEGSFTVSCEITTRSLTREGYVIEVGFFMDVVRSKFRTLSPLKASCEELAGGVVAIAHEILDRRLEEVTVEVKNKTGSVRLIWKRGELEPEFPRLATRFELTGQPSRPSC